MNVEWFIRSEQLDIFHWTQINLCIADIPREDFATKHVNYASKQSTAGIK